MHQRGGLQGLARPLARHFRGRQAAKFIVYQREQLAGSA
jgi:hypothetical protein